MKVFVGEQKRAEKLELIDEKTGQNWVADYIGNQGSWESFGFFPRPGGDGFDCSEEVFAFWQGAIWAYERRQEN